MVNRAYMRSLTARVLVVAIVGMSSALGIVSAQEQNVDEWTVERFRLARLAHEQNKLDVAAREYQLILLRNPRFAEVYLNLGIVYHQQRKYQEAVKVLQSAVSLKPNVLGAQLFLGIDKYMIQEFQGALGPLEQALRLNRADRQAGIYLALTYLALEQPERAARQLRDTARYSPQDVEISYHEGEAYLEGVRQSLALLREAGTDSALYHWALAIGAQQKNDKVSAIEEYLKALALAPDVGELYWRLAVALRGAGLSDLASAALGRYRVLNPDRDLASLGSNENGDEPPVNSAVVTGNKEAFLRLWDALPPMNRVRQSPPIADEFVNRAVKARLSSGEAPDLKLAVQRYLKADYGGAAQVLKPIAPSRTEDWLSAYLLARAYLSTSNYEAAEEVLEGRLASRFHLPSIALLRMEIQSQLAVDCFNQVMTKQPNSYLVKLLEAKSAAAAGKDREAIASYQQALKLSPDRLGVHLAIGELYENRLQWDAAIREFKAEVSLDPDNAMALVHLGHAYTQSRDADQAVHVLSRLIEIHPQDGRAYADLGKAWALKGESEKAIAAYERALRYDGTQYDLHYRLFELYRKTGQAGLAQNHLAAFKTGEAKKRASYREGVAALESEPSSH